MNVALRHLAQAFVDVSLESPAEKQAELCDVALRKLRELGLGKPREFFRAVSQVLRERSLLFRIRTALPITEAREDSLQKSVEKAVSSPVRRVTEEEKDLLGGAVLHIGDERFDASMSGMLERAARELLLPLS